MLRAARTPLSVVASTPGLTIVSIALSLTLALSAAASLSAQDLAVRDASVYTTPDAPVQSHATVLIRGGRVVAVGKNIAIPPGAAVLPCNQCVVFAGFWNVHVHFTGAMWDSAARRPAPALTRAMQDMVTHSGFTTVVDLASDPVNTTALRRRIMSGEVLGPTIYTAGSGLYPPNGVPFYLADLPASVRARLPQPTSTATAIADVERNLAYGTDVVKLFTGSYLRPDSIVHMPPDVARAAVAQGHRHGQLIFAHPSDFEGGRIAMNAGVDVLAHAPDTFAAVDDSLIQAFVNHHMAMVPTLMLFSHNRNIARIREVVAHFRGDGGRLLFGTDTGFLTDYDLTEEYNQLSLTGLTFRDVLAMLTINPAVEFDVSSHAGLIVPGYDGDLTILSADPSTGDLRDFTRVLYTVRAGKVIFDGRNRM